MLGLVTAPSPAAARPLVPAGYGTAAAAAALATGRTGLAKGVPFCKRLARGKLWASSGARMYCLGPQASGPDNQKPAAGRALPDAPGNVDAASLAEDISPAGMRAEGQSETSIAAAGPYVVEPWNDATGFISPCPSPMWKEENTGFGFSADGGKTFTDLGGPPNPNCKKFVYSGDPSVVAYQVGGATYFYLSSLYLRAGFFGFGATKIAMTACKVVGAGSTATLALTVQCCTTCR